MIILGSLRLCFWEPKIMLLMLFANLPMLFKMRKVLILFQLEVIMEVNFKMIILKSCEENVIQHNFSAPRTPQQNGVVERKNKSLEEGVRTLLNETNQPKYFWVDVGSTVCYTLNRFLIRPILKKTP